jgi:hypothetical protein
MGIKDRIGFEIYEGSLQKFATAIGHFGLRSGILGKNNAYRALYLLFKEGKVTPEDLRQYYTQVQPHVTNKKVFLMHIPKTAGTSLRTTLEEAVGVPAITAYQKETTFQATQWEDFSFWPLLSGHVHIDYFPKSHVGITAFRESRSRVLSEYRQIERRARHRRREILAFFGIATKDDDQMPWTQFREFGLLHTFYGFFTAGHRDDWQQFIKSATQPQIRSSIELGLGRIQQAAWSHDSIALERAASNILEIPVTINRVNVFPNNEIETIQLTKEDVLQLNEFANLDEIVIDTASTLGLVPKLSQSEKDALFERDVERLGFKLP